MQTPESPRASVIRSTSVPMPLPMSLLTCLRSLTRSPRFHALSEPEPPSGGRPESSPAVGERRLPSRARSGRRVCSPGAAAEPPLANLAASALISPGRNNRPALRRNGRFSGSSGGKRRPEPHGHRSFRPSFSTSSVSTPTIRLPRLTRDSLEGTPGGACQTAQKDASVSWPRYMIVLLVTQRRIVACGPQVPRAVFRRSGHPVTIALPAATSRRAADLHRQQAWLAGTTQVTR